MQDSQRRLALQLGTVAAAALVVAAVFLPWERQQFLDGTSLSIQGVQWSGSYTPFGLFGVSDGAGVSWLAAAAAACALAGVPSRARLWPALSLAFGLVGSAAMSFEWLSIASAAVCCEMTGRTPGVGVLIGALAFFAVLGCSATALVVRADSRDELVGALSPPHLHRRISADNGN